MLEQNLQKACTGLSKVVFAAACKLRYSAANHNDIPQDRRAIDRGIPNRQIASQKDFVGVRGEVSPLPGGVPPSRSLAIWVCASNQVPRQIIGSSASHEDGIDRNGLELGIGMAASGHGHCQKRREFTL
jgi:hypothetical protein